MKQVVTGDDVMAIAAGGQLTASAGALVTPWARELAATRGVRIVQAAAPAVALGADHGGFALKQELKAMLAGRGLEVHDKGAFSTDPVDYPDVALAVAQSVRTGAVGVGILIDGAGIGSCMAANKVPGVRAALCGNVDAAKNAREHNDANVLTLGAKFVDGAAAKAIVAAFLDGRCTEERHLRRVAKIKLIEESFLK